MDWGTTTRARTIIITGGPGKSFLARRIAESFDRWEEGTAGAADHLSRRRASRHACGPLCLLLDDFELEMGRDKVMRDLSMHSRVYNITLVVVAHSLKEIAPFYRTAADLYLFFPPVSRWEWNVVRAAQDEPIPVAPGEPFWALGVDCTADREVRPFWHREAAPPPRMPAWVPGREFDEPLGLIQPVMAALDLGAHDDAWILHRLLLLRLVHRDFIDEAAALLGWQAARMEARDLGGSEGERARRAKSVARQSLAGGRSANPRGTSNPLALDRH